MPPFFGEMRLVVTFKDGDKPVAGLYGKEDRGRLLYSLLFVQPFEVLGKTQSGMKAEDFTHAFDLVQESFPNATAHHVHQEKLPRPPARRW